VRLKAGAVTAIIAGLKEAGINFVATLPCTAVAPVIPHLMRDPQFKHVPVGNEGDGIVICAGAWLGGKKPALLIENTGVLVGAYALTGLDCIYGGFPMLLVVDQRIGTYKNPGVYAV